MERPKSQKDPLSDKGKLKAFSAITNISEIPDMCAVRVQLNERASEPASQRICG